MYAVLIKLLHSRVYHHLKIA